MVDATKPCRLIDAEHALHRSLAALLHVHGTRAVLGAFVDCASHLVDAGDDGDFAVAARRAAVEMSRASASSSALETLPGAVSFAEILDARTARPTRRKS
jgi:hypothetical protein